MKEFISMWKYKSMFMLLLISILFYAAVHLPFEFGLIVFDIKSFQPVNAIPVIIGLFFGPAGVLGVGIGSFFVSIYGGLSVITPFIMLGNMLMALLAFRMWDKLLLKSDLDLVIPKSGKKIVIVNLLLIVIISSMVKSLVIGCGYILTSSEVFYRRAIPLFINDTIGGFLLSVFFIFIFLKRFRMWEMIWSDLMKPGDMQVDSRIGANVAIYSILVFFLISLFLSYFGLNIFVIISGTLAILGIFTGLLWKGKTD